MPHTVVERKQSSASRSRAGNAALLVIMLCACAALALCCSHASIVYFPIIFILCSPLTLHPFMSWPLRSCHIMIFSASHEVRKGSRSPLRVTLELD